ncbi:MAG: lipid II flippase MurJ [Thermoleophilia bacterium]
MSTGRLARAGMAVAVFGLLSRFLGYGREKVLAVFYGSTGQTDSYVNALNLVNVGAALLLYALTTVVIPTFAQEEQDHGEDSAWRLMWAIAAWVSIALAAVTAVIALFPEPVAAIYQQDAHGQAQTARLITIMAPALFAQGVSALFTALLQIHGRFAMPAAIGVAFNLGIIVGVVAGAGHFGIRAAAWGVTAGAALQVVLQLPQFLTLARRQGTRPAMAHPRLTAVALISLPVFGASALQQVNSFTDRMFASTLEAGRNTNLAYANSLGALPRMLLLTPFLTPLFPLVARMVAERRDDDAVRGMMRTAGLLGLVGVPTTLLMTLYAHETAQILFAGGKCQVDCVNNIGSPLAFYGLATLGNFMSIFFNRALAAAGLQRAILNATVIVVVVTIALDWLLLGPMDQAGLAAASAIGVYLNLVLYAVSLRGRFPTLSMRRLTHQQARLLMCAAPALAVVLLQDRLMPTDHGHGVVLVVQLAEKVVLATAAYLAAAWVWARPELREAQRAAGSLVRRRRPATP